MNEFDEYDIVMEAHSILFEDPYASIEEMSQSFPSSISVQDCIYQAREDGSV